MTTRKDIIFYIDKGLSRRALLREVERAEDVDPTEADALVDEMLADGTLTTGEMHGNKDWLVVTAFMPNMAERLRDQKMPKCPHGELLDDYCFDCEDEKDGG